MIKVTRLNNKSFYVNADLIEFIEETPDTVLTLTTGKKVVVGENIETILKEIIEFRKKMYVNLPKTSVNIIDGEA